MNNYQYDNSILINYIVISLTYEQLLIYYHIDNSLQVDHIVKLLTYEHVLIYYQYVKLLTYE